MDIHEFDKKFKKGDIAIIDDRWVCILSEPKPSMVNYAIQYYGLVDLVSGYFNMHIQPAGGIGWLEEINKIRLANNVEKKALYEKLRNRGYKWNEEKFELEYKNLR